MRFSMLTILGVLAAVSCAEGQGRPPVVVLVHGRGHMDDDTASLRRAWKADLDSALAKVQMPPLANADVRLAWYADALDPSGDGGCPATVTTPDSTGFETFARDFLGSLASALPRNESREARTLLGDMLYAVDPSRRCGAQRRVGRVIDAALAEGRSVVVVAYSLGALVTYAELNNRRRDSVAGRQVHLVTIGSPLGSTDIREILGETGPLRLPSMVASWENVYDPNDAFAAPIAAHVSGAQDLQVEADSRDDPHHVSRYLRNRATGMAVARALRAH